MLEDVSPDREVTRALDSVGLESGKKLYVELLAVVDGGMIRVSGLNQARTEGRCQQPGGKEESWRAAGNEPGWLLAAGDEAVALKRPGAADLRLPFKVSGNEGGATRIEATGEGNHLAVAFEKRVSRPDGRFSFRVDGDRQCEWRDAQGLCLAALMPACRGRPPKKQGNQLVEKVKASAKNSSSGSLQTVAKSRRAVSIMAGAPQA